MQIQIRKAEKKDLKQIYKLVKELAVYENEPDAVIASLTDYYDSFDAGDFDSIVAESQRKIIGMAIYYTTFSTWRGRMIYLEDFVVNEAFRRLGVGQLIFDAFLDEARQREARLVKWQVLDWNEPALRFYKKNKAIIEKNWWNVKILFT